MTVDELRRRRQLVADARAALVGADLGAVWTGSWIDSLEDGGPGLDIHPDAPRRTDEVLQPFTLHGLVVQRRMTVIELD